MRGAEGHHPRGRGLFQQGPAAGIEEAGGNEAWVGSSNREEDGGGGAGDIYGAGRGLAM